ncbi:MAG: hypothetical protein P1P84_17800 [Deferrisomatales bacterium]|nr:hypothetical protein [Deferrisomatales bacterium]
MGKNFAILALSILLVVSVLTRSSRAPVEPWKPVLEDTSFHFLVDVTAETRKLQAAGLQELERGEAEAARSLFQDAALHLEQLATYYVPMTEIRQLVYDADRLAFLKEKERSRVKLEEARKYLLEMGAGSALHLRTTADELILMLEDTELALDRDSAELPKKFQALGHRVNLLALKGELELTD